MQAFTTGAYIVPKWIDGTWVWVVDRFEDDTFLNGEYIDAQETASSAEGLYQSYEDERPFYAVFDENGLYLKSGFNSRSKEELFEAISFLLDADEKLLDFEEVLDDRRWGFVTSDTELENEI